MKVVALTLLLSLAVRPLHASPEEKFELVYHEDDRAVYAVHSGLRGRHEIRVSPSDQGVIFLVHEGIPVLLDLDGRLWTMKSRPVSYAGYLNGYQNLFTKRILTWGQVSRIEQFGGYGGAVLFDRNGRAMGQLSLFVNFTLGVNIYNRGRKTPPHVNCQQVLAASFLPLKKRWRGWLNVKRLFQAFKDPS